MLGAVGCFIIVDDTLGDAAPVAEVGVTGSSLPISEWLTGNHDYWLCGMT